MRRLTLALCLALAAGPLAAQTGAPEDAPRDGGDLREGADLLEEGARRLLRGLLSEMEPALDEMGRAFTEMRPVLEDLAGMIGDIRNYHAPEKLPNGDIILRRKVPEPDLPPDLPEGEEIEI